MAQRPNELTPLASPLHYLGYRLRESRQARGLSLRELGGIAHVDSSYIGRIERAEVAGTPQVIEACDRALRANGELVHLHQLILEARLTADGHEAKSALHEANRAQTLQAIDSAATLTLRIDEEGNVWAESNRRTFMVASATALLQQATGVQPGMASHPRPIPTTADDPFDFARMISGSWPGVRLSKPMPDYGVDWNVLVPGGRNMTGSEAAVQLHPARAESGGITVTIPDARRADEFLRTPRRGLLVGAGLFEEEPRYYLLESREVRRRLRRAAGMSEITVPSAYRLDDLTYGILWAVTNLDDAIQADDQPLHETRHDLKAYERLSASAVSREAAPGLNAIAHMYLGSDFCARHILRCLPNLTERPIAWTREQRGEEASTWLLFDHKYAYLRETLRVVGGTMTRGFCIPESAVRDSPQYERTLLFLAVALMESLGIHVQVTTDEAYDNIEGFVLAPRKQAIIANWVRGDGMWHVDMTERSTTVRQFGDVAGDVAVQSLIEADAPAQRLEALAHYLGLPWSWLVQRCAELGKHGTTGLVQARSRLISAAGLDAACRYVGSLRTES